MSGPYRDVEPFLCPACNAALRVFGSRLCCDACEGIMLELDDLVAAVTEIVGDEPELKLVGGKPGTRACPRCRHAMATCHLDVIIVDEARGTSGHTPVAHPTVKPTLDRCASHGLWFDADELAQILTALHRAAQPPSHATLRQIVRAYLHGNKYGFTDDSW